MKNFKHIIFCLIIFPLFSIAFIIVMWPGLWSFGNPYINNNELRLFLIAFNAGGIGASLDLHVWYYSILSGSDYIDDYLLNIHFPIRISTGTFLGIIVYCCARADVPKMNTLINVSNPYSVFITAVAAGLCSQYFVLKIKRFSERWFQGSGSA